MPLHSAVHGGDIRAVELCINSGAKISTQQHDLSTPVHLACAQVCNHVTHDKCYFTSKPIKLATYQHQHIDTLIYKIEHFQCEISSPNNHTHAKQTEAVK